MHMESIPPWIMVILGVAGFLVTWTGMVIGLVKTITSITTNTNAQVVALKEDYTNKLTKLSQDTSEKIASETSGIQESLREISAHFEEDQRTQDNRFGETASAIREYINKVEKEMHQIEMWGRDNYVQKNEFLRVLQNFEKSLNELVHNMREDSRTLNGKMDAVILNMLKKED